MTKLFQFLNRSLTVSAGQLIVLGAVALSAGVAGFYIGQSRASSGGEQLFSIRTNIPPVEFLYLDYGRVLPYLSQLENGLSNNQLRTLSQSSSVNAGAEAGADLKVGGTFASESSLQETVTPTASSEFYALEEKLDEKDWLQQLNAQPVEFSEFQAALQSVDEGSFVRITNCKIIFLLTHASIHS